MVLMSADLGEGLAFRNETAVTVHANYIIGNAHKAALMNSRGFWLVDEKTKSKRRDGFSTACKPFVAL